MEGSPSQIGVNHHPRCINDSTEPRLDLPVNFFLDKGIEEFKREEGVS
jgi:hypothetical protein